MRRQAGGGSAALGAVLALGLVASAARANPLHVGTAAISPEASALWSKSRGRPWQGRLSGAVYLDQDKHVRHVERYEARDRHWGTAELVRLIQRAAREVSKAHGPGRLPVGELSARRGGRIDGHRSHQSGRDVDLGFYLRGEDRRVIAWKEFVYLRRDGTRHVDGGRTLARMDLDRNWSLVEALASAVDAPVQHLFVANSIRRILLRHGRSVGADEALLDRAARLMRPPGSGRPHTDHFHVRIECPADDRPACRD